MILFAVTNYAAIVRPLQILVMVIALLFFARVLRVAVLQSRPSDAVAGQRQRRRGRGVLALEFIEPEDRRGERVDVATGAIIGRSGDCELCLQDTYLSSRHARVANDDGDLTVEDLGSTNGTYVNQEMIDGRVRLERGDVVQVGGVVFEVVR